MLRLYYVQIAIVIIVSVVSVSLLVKPTTVQAQNPCSGLAECVGGADCSPLSCCVTSDPEACYCAETCGGGGGPTPTPGGGGPTPTGGGGGGPTPTPGGGGPTPTGGGGGGVPNPCDDIKGQKVSNLAPLPPEVNSATVHGCWASNSEPEDYCAYGFDISNNPYSSGPTRNGRWAVWVDVPAGCRVGYTLCENSTGCESSPLTTGNSVTFRCGSGDVWDVWWHFNCLASSIPSCAVSLNPLPAMSVGQSIKLIPNVNQANGTVDEVTFTINASSTGTAVLCADDLNYTNPCSPGALTYVDNVTGFSAKLSLLTPGTIVVDVAGRMLDDPPAPPYNCTGGSGSGDVAGPPPWWQVIGGDIWSGSTSIGSIYSPIPSSSLFPFLIRDNPTNHPGIPAAGSTINLSSGEPSSQGWVAQNVPYLNTDSYSYDFFEKKIPSQVLSNIETTVNENTLENGGFSYGGYYWFKHTGGSLILDSNDVPNKLISLANRKVIVFVESGDVTINTKIRFGDGVGAFYLIANYNVLIDPEVGGVASNPNRLVDLEGLIFADGQIRTGTRDNDLDQQLYVRGILAGLGIIGNGPIGARDGVDLQRDLPDNSTYPAELIQFAPDLVLNWPPYLSTKHVTWREVAP